MWNEKNQIVSIDTVGPLPEGQGGVKCMLTTIDVLTKYAKLYPIKHCKTEAVINKIFKTHIPECGKMENLQFDNASIFKNPING